MNIPPSRSGSILVYVVIAVGLVTSLALVTGSLVFSRSKLASDCILRAELRDAAISAVAQTAWQIHDDTNGVDHLLEPWAEPREIGCVRVHVEDEMARLSFQKTDIEGLAYLVEAQTGLLSDEALSIANRLKAWWEDESKATRDEMEGTVGAEESPMNDSTPQGIRTAQDSTSATSRVLVAEEELVFVPTMEPVLMGNLIPRLTVWGEGQININTVERDVFIATALNVDADYETAAKLYGRVVRARRRGQPLESLDITEARKLLADMRDMPSAKELSVLQSLVKSCSVESGVFRITAVAEQQHVRRTIQCVYERKTGKILRWLEF